MRVRCIAEELTPTEAAQMQALYHQGRQTFGVTRGAEYLVFGLRMVNGVALVDIAQEFDQLYPVPLTLFEITDPRIPGIWEARVTEDGALFLWLPSFFDRAYYHQDLLEQVPSVVEDFQRIRQRLELESRIG